MLPIKRQELAVTFNLGMIVEQINQPRAARSRLAIDQKTLGRHSQHQDAGRGKRGGRRIGSQKYCGVINGTQLSHEHWHKNGGGVSYRQNARLKRRLEVPGRKPPAIDHCSVIGDIIE
jgi:hypothetical protein